MRGRNLKLMVTTRDALVAIFAGAVLAQFVLMAPQASAHPPALGATDAVGDVGGALQGSLNVVRVGHVELPGTLSVAFSSKAPLAYASARRGGGVVATFDISEPTNPKKLGEVSVPSPSYMEDMDLGERPDGTAFVLVRGKRPDFREDGGLQIVDVTDPRNPTLRGYVPFFAHNWTCTNSACDYAYGAVPGNYPPAVGFPIVNLRDLNFPSVTSVPQGNAFADWGTIHHWDRDGAGLMWSASGEGVAAYDATDPRAPTLLNSSDENGVRGLSEYNDRLQLHGSLRPNAERFGQTSRSASADVQRGNVLLMSEEGNNHDCTDSFQTWYVPHLDAARYQADNPGGLIGGGSITPLDSWSLLNDTTPGQTRPLTGQWCSVHWFDYHQKGFVVLPTYQHGTHVLDVNDARDIRQVGYHFTAGNNAMQSYWVPERDRRGSMTGKASTVAYTADSGDPNRILQSQEPISGGIDIFQVTLPK